MRISTPPLNLAEWIADSPSNMRIDIKFRHSPASSELKDYVSERIAHLRKFEMKPVHFEVTFTAQKSMNRVDIHVRGESIEMHAHSEADDYFTGVDEALEKIARQLARHKAKVQAHKGPGLSASKIEPEFREFADDPSADLFSDPAADPAADPTAGSKTKAPKVS